MKASELKQWMQKHSKSAVDVASLTKVSPQTVVRFLEGETDPRPIVLEAFKRLVRDSEEPPKTA